MATGGSYDYRGFTVVLNGTGYTGAAVYGNRGFERLFSGGHEAEEWIDSVLEAEEYVRMDMEGK